MKKILLTISLLTFFVVPANVLAEDVDSTQTSLKDRIRARVEEVKENVQERKEIRVTNRLERRDERSENHAERLSNRFGIYYDRLSKIISNVSERFDILKGEGKDVTSAVSKLNEAKAKLEEAKTLGEEAVSGFNSIEAENYEAQKEIAINARDKANLARKAFIETSKLIREAVRLAKSL